MASSIFPAMHSPLKRLIALLVAVAFAMGYVHCSLDNDCAEKASAPAACQVCCCHVPVVSESKPVLVWPRPEAPRFIAVSLEPNDRLASVSIFNPPKA